MNDRTVLVTSEAELKQFAQQLAERLPPGTTIALDGTLGAGKTRFVQGLAAGLGVKAEEVVSPTYGLCHEHEGSPGLNHLDLYRVADADELLELGFDDIVQSDRITAIEWADRFREELPVPRLEVTIEVTGESSRAVHLRVIGNSEALARVVRRG